MNDQDHSPPAIAKATLAPGGAIAALVPQSLDDAFRLSKALAASGDMVPRHFQNKPEMVMAAVVRGMEIGLAPMQALSNIAVINGRASIWGDALPALLQRAGHDIDSWVEGEGDNMVAIAEVTRGDTGKVIRRTFSAADAKAAGLWNKPGPWQNYKARMLQMRARSFAARDGAADALMGLQVAEEMQDVPPPRDVTPRPADPNRVNLAQRLRGEAELPPAIPADPVQPDDPPIEGTAGHWTDGFPLEDAAPGSIAWNNGMQAAQDGKARTDCPYDEADPQAVADWLAAYDGTRRAME